MMLRLIGIDVLAQYGIEESLRAEIAGKIEEKYTDAVAAMFVELTPKTERPIKLDTKEIDSLSRESIQKEPVDDSLTSAGTYK